MRLASSLSPIIYLILSTSNVNVNLDKLLLAFPSRKICSSLYFSLSTTGSQKLIALDFSQEETLDTPKGSSPP